MEKGQRQKQYAREIIKLVGRFLAEKTNQTSMVTITHSEISSDLRSATVYFTVLPREKTDTSQAFLNRLRPEVKEYIKKNMSSRVVPFISFEVDRGELHRQRIDELLRNPDNTVL